jgi:uncharacterized protein (TIGR03437 family)
VLDYKLADYQPQTYVGLLAATITTEDVGLTNLHRAGATFTPDISGPGQEGRLRTAVKVDRSDFYAEIYLLDTATVILDNVRLLKGTGGVYRRDFENGIALVNPTPEALFVSQDPLRGPLGRTGIRRIRGAQDPSWNTGEVVTDGIVIPSGDGIILLADGIPAPALQPPQGLTGLAQGTNIQLTWHPSSDSTAGYAVRYGENNELTRWAAAGKIPFLYLTGLEPGAEYTFRVAAYDYLGKLSAFSDPIPVTTEGLPNSNRPSIFVGSERPTLVPGGYVTLNGSNLAETDASIPGPPYPGELSSTRVLVNGLAAPLVEISPSRVGFFVPWEIAGDQAIVRIQNTGGTSADRFFPVRPAMPLLWSWDGEQAIAIKEAGFELVTEADPAREGESILLIGAGLGLIEPPPTNGDVPRPGARTLVAPDVEIEGTIVEATAEIFNDLLGIYSIRFTVPTGLSTGTSSVRVLAEGVQSNAVRMPFE